MIAMHGNAELTALLARFPLEQAIARMDPVPADAVPPPHHQLLVHEQHMTVTVEAYHRSPVIVDVLATWRGDHAYARKILLRLPSDGRAVLFGLVSINMGFCNDNATQAILNQEAPLGRILIANNILTRIEPTAFWRVTPGSDMQQWFGLATPRDTFGRTAIIHCNGEAAITLLEIVTPEA